MTETLLPPSIYDGHRGRLPPNVALLVDAMQSVAYSELSQPNGRDELRTYFTNAEDSYTNAIRLRTAYHIGVLSLFVSPEHEWRMYRERSVLVASLFLNEYRPQGGNMKKRVAEMPPKELRTPYIYGSLDVISDGTVTASSNNPMFEAAENVPDEEKRRVAALFSALGMPTSGTHADAHYASGELDEAATARLTEFLTNGIAPLIVPGERKQLVTVGF